MRNDNGVHFDIRFDQGMFGGFPSAEKAADYLRAHPDDEFTNVKLFQVTHHSGRTLAEEVPLVL